MTMVQNVRNYISHMSHQAGIGLLVLSIYFDSNWKAYKERLCFLTSYEAPSCQGYFFLSVSYSSMLNTIKFPDSVRPRAYDPIPHYA